MSNFSKSLMIVETCYLSGSVNPCNVAIDFKKGNCQDSNQNINRKCLIKFIFNISSIQLFYLLQKIIHSPSSISSLIDLWQHIK